MKILKQESETCRIVQKWSFRALGFIVCRQRKGKFFWRQTAWLYTGQEENVEGYARHFDWEEANKEIGSFSQF